MTHPVYRIEVTYRSSPNPHIFEFRTEREMNDRHRELSISQYNDRESSDIVTLKREVKERDNNPQGVTRDVALVAVYITRKLFIPIAHKTLLTAEQVADKVAVLALQTNAMLTEKRLPITAENVEREATSILFVSHNIHV